jgi:hypothetical protein
MLKKQLSATLIRAAAIRVSTAPEITAKRRIFHKKSLCWARLKKNYIYAAVKNRLATAAWT